MNVAVPLPRTSIATDTGTIDRQSRIAIVEVCRDLADAVPIWLRMKAEGALATPYQHYDFIHLWQRHVGDRNAVKPSIMVGYDAGRTPLVLLPFGTNTAGPLRVLQFLGGKHANINFGVWNRNFAASITAPEVHNLLDRIAQNAPGVDLVALHRQPHTWENVANPFLHLPHQPSPSGCCCGDLRPATDNTGRAAETAHLSRSMRKQLRSKERKLAELPGFRYFRATTPAEVDRLLTWFFAIKAVHLKAHGLANTFADPGIEDFVRDLCHRGLDEGQPVAELHAIEADGELLAVYAGTGNGKRFSLMINTYTLSEHARLSPGLVLLMHMFAALTERGFHSVDLGAGDARYKRGFCRQDEPLFESFLPLTPLGRLAAVGARSGTSLKRRIKSSPVLWPAYQTIRRHVSPLLPV